MALIHKRKAVIWKYPDLVHGKNADYFELNRNDETGESTWVWNTSKYPEPTEAELQEWTDNQSYILSRKVSFPTWQEQLDMQYWDQVNGTTTWKDAIAKVKSDNPKE